MIIFAFALCAVLVYITVKSVWGLFKNWKEMDFKSCLINITLSIISVGGFYLYSLEAKSHTRRDWVHTESLKKQRAQQIFQSYCALFSFNYSMLIWVKWVVGILLVKINSNLKNYVSLYCVQIKHQLTFNRCLIEGELRLNWSPIKHLFFHNSVTF